MPHHDERPLTGWDPDPQTRWAKHEDELSLLWLVVAILCVVVGVLIWMVL